MLLQRGFQKKSTGNLGGKAKKMVYLRMLTKSVMHGREENGTEKCEK